MDFQESSNSSSIEVCETSEVCDFKGTICNQNFSDDLSLDHLGAADFYQEPLEMQSAPYAEGILYITFKSLINIIYFQYFRSISSPPINR